MNNTIPLNRGSDCSFGGTLTDDQGAPINLTGYTISAFEASTELAGFLTLTIVNAAAGTWSGHIEWDDGFKNGAYMQFRILFSVGSDRKTTPAIWVDVS